MINLLVKLDDMEIHKYVYMIKLQINLINVAIVTIQILEEISDTYLFHTFLILHEYYSAQPSLCGDGL